MVLKDEQQRYWEYLWHMYDNETDKDKLRECVEERAHFYGGLKPLAGRKV